MSNRIIKDSITTSETLALLSGDEERHFFRLITKADDYGRFDARPHVIRAGLYAAMLDQVPTIESERRTLSLASAGLISLYDADGRRYGQIITWEKHQRVRAKVSKFPPPPSLDSIGGHLLSDDNTRQHTPRVATSGALILNPESGILNPESVTPPTVPQSGDTAPSDAQPETQNVETTPKQTFSSSEQEPERRANTAPRAAKTVTRTKNAPPWEPPAWFAPLVSLPGYTHRQHDRAVAQIEAACREAGVGPGDVVAAFAAYYRTAAIANGWTDPVAACRGRPLAISITQVVRGPAMADALAAGLNHLSPLRRNGTGPPVRAGPMVEASTEELTPAEIERDKRLEEQLDGWRRIAAAKRAAAAAAKAGVGS